jgi:hypothetical protein
MSHVRYELLLEFTIYAGKTHTNESADILTSQIF